MPNGYDNQQASIRPSVPHYYGDQVRRLFLVGGIVVLAGMLLDNELLTLNVYTWIISVLALTLLAGFTSPKSRAVSFVNILISAVFFSIFEYYSISAYLKSSNFFDTVFLLRQAPAVIFLVAFYFSAKTLRGMMLR